jgi:hypothetical protein
MRCQADQERSTEARSATTAAPGSASPAALPALQLLIDPGAGRVLVRDRGETFGYQLEYRAGSGLRGGVGWVEYGTAADGSRYRVGVSAAEVMAVARDAGRDEDVAQLTERVAAEFGRGGDSKVAAQVARLRAEVDASIPCGRIGAPEEIAHGALFLASDDSSYVTASTFLVDGGLSAAYVTPE